MVALSTSLNVPNTPPNNFNHITNQSNFILTIVKTLGKWLVKYPDLDGNGFTEGLLLQKTFLTPLYHLVIPEDILIVGAAVRSSPVMTLLFTTLLITLKSLSSS